MVFQVPLHENNHHEMPFVAPVIEKKQQHANVSIAQCLYEVKHTVCYMHHSSRPLLQFHVKHSMIHAYTYSKKEITSDHTVLF